MGFWGGDNDQSNNDANQLIESQIAQNNIEIENRKRTISKERLDLIKSQGAPNWSPAPPVARRPRKRTIFPGVEV